MLLTWKQRVFDLLLDIFHHIRSWVNGILPTEVWTACEKSDQVFGWSCSTSPTCHPMPKRLRINLKWWLEIGNAQEVVPNTQLLKMIGNWKRSNFNVPPRCKLMQVAPLPGCKLHHPDDMIFFVSGMSIGLHLPLQNIPSKTVPKVHLKWWIYL